LASLAAGSWGWGLGRNQKSDDTQRRPARFHGGGATRSRMVSSCRRLRLECASDRKYPLAAQDAQQHHHSLLGEGVCRKRLALRQRRQAVAVVPEGLERLELAGLAHAANTQHAQQHTSGEEQEINRIQPGAAGQHANKPDHGCHYSGHNGKDAYSLPTLWRRDGWRGNWCVLII